VRSGAVLRLARPVFEQLMRDDADLSEHILRAFIARRAVLRTGTGSHSVEVLGSRWCAHSLALRSWAARQQVAHSWLDIETADGTALAAAFGFGPPDLPVVVTSGALVRNATPELLAGLLGLAHRPHPGRVRDVLVIGGGPAGLAVSVCAASEGLDTLLVDRPGSAARRRPAPGSRTTSASPRESPVPTCQGGRSPRRTSSEPPCRVPVPCAPCTRRTDGCSCRWRMAASRRRGPW
jgi:thioredoxin reductase (NADPH)